MMFGRAQFVLAVSSTVGAFAEAARFVPLSESLTAEQLAELEGGAG